MILYFFCFGIFMPVIASRMERQRHEDELKNRAMKKSSDADQNRVYSVPSFMF
jgi:hypothetical protein